MPGGPQHTLGPSRLACRTPLIWLFALRPPPCRRGCALRRVEVRRRARRLRGYRWACRTCASTSSRSARAGSSPASPGSAPTSSTSARTARAPPWASSSSSALGRSSPSSSSSTSRTTSAGAGPTASAPAPCSLPSPSSSPAPGGTATSGGPGAGSPTVHILRVLVAAVHKRGLKQPLTAAALYEDRPNEARIHFNLADICICSHGNKLCDLYGLTLQVFQGASKAWNIPIAFISVVLLPIVGNAAEHASAVMFAQQISMFGIPFCVVIGWMMGQPMDLNFHLFETASLLITVLVVAFLLQDGTSNCLKGLMLFLCYLIVAASFYVHADPNTDDFNVSKEYDFTDDSPTVRRIRGGLLQLQ